MRLVLKNLLFAALCLAGPSAFAFTTPSVEGRMVNHSQYPIEHFEIVVDLMCKKAGVIWPKACGQDSVTVRPDAAGNFTIRALKVGDGLFDDHTLRASVRLKGMSGDHSLSMAFWNLSGKDIKKKLSRVKTITVFGLPERVLTFNLASGRDGALWARGEGRESRLEYSFDFTGGNAEFGSPYLVRTEQSGLTNGDTGTFSARVLIVPGASSGKVKVTRTLSNRSLAEKVLDETTMTIDLLEPLPPELFAFNIDDRTHLPVLRALDGRWQLTLQFTSHSPDYENNTFDAEMTAQCVNGQIEGSMRVTARGGNRNKFNGSVAVGGECGRGAGGEEGVLHFAMPAFSKGGVQQWSARYMRITPRMLMSTERDAIDSNRGDEFVMRLKIRNATGEMLGSIYSERL